MIRKFLRKVAFGFRLLDVREFSLAFGRCPFCGRTIFFRLNADDSGIRCGRCTASLVHLSIGFAIRSSGIDVSGRDVCEFSASGPYVEFLKRAARTVALSEFVDGARPGEWIGGVRCEDVQHLSYEDRAFDLVTHTEVMEHVPDDRKAFSELRRVLRNDGVMLFTVPLYDASTKERAALANGVVEHIEPPVYHIDPWQGGSGILAFRDYGRDIVNRLLDCGFSRVDFIENDSGIPWIKLGPVIIARA